MRTVASGEWYADPVRGYQPSRRAHLTRWALAVVSLGVLGALVWVATEWFLRRADDLFSTERSRQ